ncbi:STAS domain-containing protein [Nocardioides conyzicola]|uniref:STAS domain-containing protein n=1 Tax=Nocardioides conyzicola TaxID=1651781 RepID=A0ABP8Y3A2_9ACTN
MNVLRTDAPSVSVHRYWFGAWTVVRVEGEMDVQAQPLIEHLVGGDRFIAFELDAVTFVDACGLGTLLSRQRRARAAGGLVQLIEPAAPVRRLLWLTGSAGHFPVVPADRAVAVLMGTGPWSGF